MEVAVAGSIAKIALNLIVKIATTAITDETGSGLGVEEELRFIKQEFEMMQVFLLGASKENVKGELMTTWIKQVQELAIDLENCLEEASVHLTKEKNYLLYMCSVKKRNHVAKKIRVLKSRTIDVINRKQRYEQISKENGGHTYDETASTISISNVEKLLVGLNEPKRILLELILKNNEEHSYMPWNEKGIILVVGTGGIGKTTLVREVYGCQQLRNEFKCFAWVTVQHPFNKDEFIEILANQILFDAQEIDNNWGTITEKTKEKVTEYLKENKYLIVLDDLCTEWDIIEDVIPPFHGSRIIVTTRSRDPWAEYISHPSDNIYEIKKLSKKDAFDLFCIAVYKTPCYLLLSDEGTSSIEITEEDSQVHSQCLKIAITAEMQVQAGLIIESCGRLPLAIEIIGSYLATKPKTSVEWKKMHDQLCSELDNHPHAKTVEVVLTTIYNGMPNHLKQCLLDLSVFHKHKEIRRSRIIRRWMASGYVKDNKDMKGRKKMAEEVGKEYLCDLMSRSLIQLSKMSTIIGDGDIKRCNIHNLIYEFILGKAKNESMVSILEDKNHETMTNKARHLIITGGPCTHDNVIEKVELSSNQRSVSIFGEVGNSLTYPIMNLIRVLDLEGNLNLQNRDLRGVGRLSLLKYLGLRGTKITKLPDTLGKLGEVETLDIRNTAVVRLPTGLAKLKKLSYLRAGFDLYNNPKNRVKFKDENHIPIFVALCSGSHDNHDADKYKSSGVRAPQGIGKLRQLNIFGVIDIGGSKSLAKELQNLTNLRKLAVTGFTKQNGKILAKVINRLKHLRSLVLSATDDLGLRCCLNYVSSPPKYLQSLKLYSYLGELPIWISCLENLEKIHFRNTCLHREIKAIEKLPNLKILHMLKNSFREDLKELCFSEYTFPMLQVMILESLRGLESVVIEKTALKRLEQLKIRRCWEMREDGVSGLNFLEQLKEMEVVGIHGDKESKREFANIRDQLKKLPKEPILKVF